MPVIEAKLIEGVLTDAQKKDLIRRLTDAMVAVEGEGMRRFTYVIIEEAKNGEWGIGGHPMTAADVHGATRTAKSTTG